MYCFVLLGFADAPAFLITPPLNPSAGNFCPEKPDISNITPSLTAAHDYLTDLFSVVAVAITAPETLGSGELIAAEVVSADAQDKQHLSVYYFVNGVKGKRPGTYLSNPNSHPNAGGGGGFGFEIECDGEVVFVYGAGAGGGVATTAAG